MFEERVKEILTAIEEMLIEKNRKYGNSALEPARVFSSADPVEQIKVRIDDKLSRIKNQQSDEDEDVINDLIGYLVLLKIAVGDKGNTRDVITYAPECGIECEKCGSYTFYASKSYYSAYNDTYYTPLTCRVCGNEFEIEDKEC